MAIYENKFEIGDVVWFNHLGNQYSGWYSLVKLFGVEVLSACDRATKCIIKNYTLHTNEHNKVFVYLLEDDDNNNYLVNDEAIELYSGQDKDQSLIKQVQKQQYKPRAKWVKNTGEKPDLPDGTLVKVKLRDGGDNKRTVWQFEWSMVGDDGDILKWKLADDWNEVVDGQAPDIDGNTLIDVKWFHGEVSKGYHMESVVGWEGSVKKWRYAKEKKAK